MAQSNPKTLTYDDYGVAIICPLQIEMSAVRYMLDEEHACLPNKEGDTNDYYCGRMSGHNVVIGYLPQGSQGIGAAAVVATNMQRTFPQATLRLLVGIGGAIPSQSNDIRLGDVVVSMPTGVHGGVVQYDLGKETITGFEQKGFLEPPELRWRTRVVKIQSDHLVRDNQIPAFLDAMISKYPRLTKYRRPAEEDILFLPSNEHVAGELTCHKCDHTGVIKRPSRSSNVPVIFYGLIASGNRVIKNAEVRDKIAQDAGGALCFEMEAAGLMNDFRCIVIRGISDYADSHKNDDWHAYAAAVAAGCTKELLTYMDSVVDGHTSDRSQYWTINRPTNPHFTGRAELVAEIADMIRSALQDDSRTDQFRIVITGMGGQGKSEICLHVANKVRSLFWGVFWVDVHTPASAESGFLTIARRLNIDASTAGDVCQHLASIKQSWLLILDNADDANVDYQHYFPSGSSGIVLLTSRNRECHEYATEPAISLDGLSPRDACALLSKVAQLPQPQAQPQSQSHDEQHQKHIESVAVSLLKGHPLAIIQAGAYILQGHCSISRYSDVFERQRKRLLTFRPKQARSRYRDVYATFEASAEILQSSSEEASSDALQLLSVLSMLASSPLPLSLFEAAWEGARDVLREAGNETNDSNETDDDNKTGVDIDQLVPWHVAQLLPLLGAEEEAWDPFRWVEAVRLLEAYSLIFVTGNEGSISVSMHPLTHAWAKDRQQSTAQRQSWLGAACMVAISGYQRTFWQSQQLLRPHVPALVMIEAKIMFVSGLRLMNIRLLLRIGRLLNDLRIDKELFVLCQQTFQWLGIDSKTVNVEWLPLYRLAAQNLDNHGHAREAVHLLEQIVETQEQTLAEDHPDRLASQHALAGAYQANGQVQQAVSLLEQVVRIKEQTLAEDHPDRLASQHALAGAYQANGQVQQAVSLLEQVVRIQEQTLAEDHPSRLASQHALAGAYQANGQVQRAVSLLEQVVRIQEQTLAEDHPSRLASQHALAGAYQANGQVQRAVSLLEQVVRIQEQTLAEDHPSRLASQHALAGAYQANGQVQQAVSLLEQVVRIQEQTLAEDHPSRLASQHALAGAYQANGQVQQAVSLLEQVVRIREQTLAEDHPDRLASQHALAGAYQANGQVQQAVSLLEQVVRIKEQTLAEDHPSRLASQHALAGAYQANGQVQQAVSLLEQVVRIKEQTLAEDHPSRLASQHALAGAYQANGQVQQAVSPLEQVVRIREQTLAEDHPDRLASQHALAGAYQANGQVQQAVSLLEQVVRIKEQTLAEDHPSRLASQHALAGAYQANGQVQQAVSLLEQVVRIKEQTLAEDHPSRLASQHALAGAYQANGQVQQAVSPLEQVVRIREQTLAEDHPDRLASQHALAGAYQANGQVQQAVSLLEQVVRIKEQTLAEDHPSRLASQHALAGAYQANGQVQQAVSLLEQVVRIEERTLAEDHPSRLVSQQVLAATLWDAGEYDISYQMMSHVAELIRCKFDEQHPVRRATESYLWYMKCQMEVEEE